MADTKGSGPDMRISPRKRWPLGFLPMEFVDSLKRMQLASPGSILFLLILISPVVVWVLHIPESARDPFVAVAKFNAFMAISALSLNFVLATKWRMFENLFLGLDRMYRAHKALGRCSLFFMILHPLFLGISKYPDTRLILTYIFPIGPLDVTLGVLALYLFLMLLVLTVALNIPYHWWHNSHKVMGVVLVAAGLHAFWAGSDIAKYPILMVWLLVLFAAGVFSWLYMLLLFKYVARRYKVRLKKVDLIGPITEVHFKKPKGFDFLPGQYVFIRFPRFEGYKELFPFSISSDPAQGFVRLSIKRSGDYTSTKVPQLKKGDSAIVMGPYGMFGSEYLKHQRDMVWIAGGIGITPFLSMAKHESLNPTGRKILLVWVVKNKDEAFHHRELLKEAAANRKFHYILWSSQDKGRLSTKDVVDILEHEDHVRDRTVFLCGPPTMMYGISKDMHKMGIPYRRTVFEDFNMLD